jgi:hypothetical protein
MNHYNHYLDIVISLLGNGNTTTNIELDNLSKELFEELYVGSYPSDLIPELQRNHCAIINTDPSNKSGTHWIAIVRSGGGRLMKYNSFGNEEPTVIVSLGGSKDTDTDREQSSKETNCGQRCIAWLLTYYLHGEDVAMTI